MLSRSGMTRYAPPLTDQTQSHIHKLHYPPPFWVDKHTVKYVECLFFLYLKPVVNPCSVNRLYATLYPRKINFSVIKVQQAAAAIKFIM